MAEPSRPRDRPMHPRETAPSRRDFARPGRFELPTLGSVDQCSIQLSYGRVREVANHSHRTLQVNNPRWSDSTLGGRCESKKSAKFATSWVPYDFSAGGGPSAGGERARITTKLIWHGRCSRALRLRERAVFGVPYRSSPPGLRRPSGFSVTGPPSGPIWLGSENRFLRRASSFL